MPDAQTLSAYGASALESWNAFTLWANQHPGLGSWIGAVGALLAVPVAWVVTRAEYQGDRRKEQAWLNNEIDLILRIVNDFEGLYAQYARKANGADDTGSHRFYRVHANDPEMRAVRDLAGLPVNQWPSVESYMLFKRYYNAAITVLEQSDDQNTAGFPPAAQLTEHDTWLTKLRNALQGAKR